MRSLLAFAGFAVIAGCGSVPNETKRFAFTQGMTVSSEHSDSAGNDAGFTTRFRSNKSVLDVVAAARQELPVTDGWIEEVRDVPESGSNSTRKSFMFSKATKNGKFEIQITQDPAGRAATYVSVRQRVHEDKML